MEFEGYVDVVYVVFMRNSNSMINNGTLTPRPLVYITMISCWIYMASLSCVEMLSIPVYALSRPDAVYGLLS